MSQNLIPFRKSQFEIEVFQDTDGKLIGKLNEEGENFLSQNMQFLRFVFSPDGHLTPSGTTAEIKELNTAQYKSRLRYNTQTDNFMGNVTDTFKNFVMSSFDTPIHLSLSEDGRLILEISKKKYFIPLAALEEK